MDELIGELRRIADAFEAQNDFNERWMALNTKWHEEAETLNEQRHQKSMDLARQVFVFQQECHEEAERLNEQRYREVKARENKVALAAMAYYTRQNEETP